MASYASKSHDPIMSKAISHFVKKKYSVTSHDSDDQRGHRFPSGWITRSYIALGACYVRSTTSLRCGVLLKLWCSTVDVSQCCFTVWLLPRPVTQDENVYFIPHYELCVYSDSLGHVKSTPTSKTFLELIYCPETFTSNCSWSPRIPQWFHTAKTNNLCQTKA